MDKLVAHLSDSPTVTADDVEAVQRLCHTNGYDSELLVDMFIEAPQDFEDFMREMSQPAVGISPGTRMRIKIWTKRQASSRSAIPNPTPGEHGHMHVSNKETRESTTTLACTTTSSARHASSSQLDENDDGRVISHAEVVAWVQGAIDQRSLHNSDTPEFDVSFSRTHARWRVDCECGKTISLREDHKYKADTYKDHLVTRTHWQGMRKNRPTDPVYALPRSKSRRPKLTADGSFTLRDTLIAESDIHAAFSAPPDPNDDKTQVR